MVKFLIATHGFLADGLKSSIGVLMGKDIADSIETINAFVEGGTDDPKGAIEKYCNQLIENDELIIFTDLMYGSVNQFALPFSSKDNVFVLTGTNFPLICEVISKLKFGPEDAKVEAQSIKEIVDKAREQIMFVENFDKFNANDNKEEDFF